MINCSIAHKLSESRDDWFRIYEAPIDLTNFSIDLAHFSLNREYKIAYSYRGVHTFIQYLQRVLNGQPLGGFIRSGGVPSIGISLRFSPPSTCGMEPSSPIVYGWRGW